MASEFGAVQSCCLPMGVLLALSQPALELNIFAGADYSRGVTIIVASGGSRYS